MSKGKQFGIADQDLAAKPFHYKACGLDDVYLLNGFERRETDYGPAVSIAEIDDLHQAIGLQLVLQRKTISPKEFRFLRKEMDLTQLELADALGVSDQTVARYEKGQTPIAGPADRLVRFVYILSILPEDLRLRVVDRLKESVSELQNVDEVVPHPMYFQSTESGWNEAA